MSQIRLRILLLEDDVDDAALFRDIVEQSAAEMGELELDVHRSLESALPQLQRGEYDVIFTDYYLSGASLADESGATALPLIRRAIGSERKIPLVLWTASSRLDVDPETIKAVLNQQVRFMPKQRFSAGSLRYLLWALQSEAVPVLIVDPDSDEADQVTQRIQLSEFYSFQPQTVASMEAAREVARIMPHELCLIERRVVEADEAGLEGFLEESHAGVVLLDLDDHCADLGGRLKTWAEQGRITCMTHADLERPDLSARLMQERNRI